MGWKNSGLYGIWAHDHCDTGAAPEFFFNRPYREDRFHIHFLNCSRAAFYEPALGHRLSNILLLSFQVIGE